ncbi:MAG: BatA domain-containing protein [Fibrobacteria bacterium]
MFTLLNPIGLWLGAALAVPLMIHFLGRQRLRKQPFPSLLLVQERFSKSMHRHRLKNLLLLIIRTLLILCLLLALANPAMEAGKSGSPKNGVKPDITVALIHNGIYGRLAFVGTGPVGGTGTAEAAPGSDRESRSPALDTQIRRLRAWDSAQAVKSRTVPVIADGPGALEVSERFGDYLDGVRRAVEALGTDPGTAQLLLPVFDWNDAAAAQAVLERALKDSPGLQVLLADYGATPSRLNAFSSLRSTPSQDAPTLRVSARVEDTIEASGRRARVFLNGRPFQEAAVAGGRAEAILPLGDGSRTVGRFSLSAGEGEDEGGSESAAALGLAARNSGFAAPDLFFCFPDAGRWILAHSGSTFASLPSLGREAYFRRIVHVAASKDIPWSPSRTGGDLGGSGGRGGRGELRLVYLSAERGTRADAYAQSVEFVKQGGRLIIGVGRESDIPMLNRFLLQPLRLGRLGNLVETASGSPPVPVTANRQALQRIGKMPLDPGSLGVVRKRFAFLPDSGTGILLAQGGQEGALLACRDFHRGQALLWTTDIDDLEWSDIGVSPFTPLLHRAFQEAGAGERAVNLAVASDSIYTVALNQGDARASQAAGPSGSSGPTATVNGVEVRDPEGRPFTKVRSDGARLRIGPFDQLGIHLILTGRDTLAFAVNLAERANGGDPPGVEAGNGIDARSKLLMALKSYHGRVRVISPDGPISAPASTRRLWPMLLLAALLLLFLEGLISATFSLRKTRP